MRLFLVGIICLMSPVIALAQATGEVETIGFGNYYRPGCWTPMVVRLTPTTTKTEKYLLQVTQNDLDQDKVVFSRLIVLTGSVEGQVARDQRFWMYFIPDPTQGGLPDRNGSVSSLQQLSTRLKVRLSSSAGKELVKIPVTAALASVDYVASSGVFSALPGVRHVIVVSEGNSTLPTADFSNIVGMLETVIFTTIRPQELPESALAYQGIDGLIFLNAAPPDPNSAESEPKMRALREYVRNGGRLVICQPAEWQKSLAFGDLLPVTPQSVVDVPEMPVLAKWVNTRLNAIDPQGAKVPTPRGAFRVVRASANAGTLVDERITLPDRPESSVYLARQGYGAGMTVWVAQDLGDASLKGAFNPRRAGTEGAGRSAWPYVWDRIFDWRNDARPPAVSPDEPEYYAPAGGVDLGDALRQGMDLTGKSYGLIGLAIVFFLVYWAVAGPGAYFYLAARNRTRWSWFAFGLVAILFTGLTVILVKLVLSGPPELTHVSLVRSVRGQDATVDSRFGLYIPEDGYRNISIAPSSSDAATYLTAFPIHPQHLKDEKNYFPSEYGVTIRDPQANEPVEVSIKYRSTLKKMQARWAGKLDAAIEGMPVLADAPNYLDGSLTNRSGVDLKNVYVAMKHIDTARGRPTLIAYTPLWTQGTRIEAPALFAKPLHFNNKTPYDGETLYAPIGVPGSQTGWESFWYSQFRRDFDASPGNDFGQQIPKFFPMLSFYDLLAPSRNKKNNDTSRVELLRRGGRDWDISSAVSAGNLVILGQADQTPLPYDVQVEGKPMRGTGTTFYQFVIPIVRGELDKPFEADVQDQ